MTALLEARGLVKRFGGVTAVRQVDLTLQEGGIFGLIGPNGAGKTTLFKLLAGVDRPTEGEVLLRGERLTGLPAHAVVQRGVVHTHQVVRPFRDLTVRENVRVGALFGTGGGLTANESEIEQLLDMVGLAHRADQEASQLNLVQSKRLEIARALATKPALILLDEVMGGLNPTEIEQTMELVRKIRATGVTVLLIEHHLRAVMGVCERVTVLNYGEKIAEGRPQEVVEHPAVIEAYLGAPLTEDTR